MVYATTCLVWTPFAFADSRGELFGDKLDIRYSPRAKLADRLARLTACFGHVFYRMDIGWKVTAHALTSLIYGALSWWQARGGGSEEELCCVRFYWKFRWFVYATMSSLEFCALFAEFNAFAPWLPFAAWCFTALILGYVAARLEPVYHMATRPAAPVHDGDVEASLDGETHLEEPLLARTSGDEGRHSR